MTNSKYVPKRRFKEFELDGEWERDLFGNIADFSIKTNSFSREKLTHESYEVQNIHYGDILIKFQSVLDLKRDNLPSIIDSNVLDFRQSLLQDGDVIFADAAEDSTVGKAIEIRNIMGKNVVSGLHTIAARPIQLFAPYYLGYYLNSDFYHKQILPLMQGTKVSSISKSNLQVTEISFPIIDEQKQIGKFFQTIDSLLSIHQHKLDKLKNLKKAYFAEMLPTKGESVPKRRFPGFEGEWDQVLLGKIVDFSIKTNSFSREKLTQESYEVQNIHYGDILVKFQSVLDLKRDNLPSIIDSSVLDFRQSLLQDGDVIFADAAEDSTVGKAIEIRNIMGKNVVSGLHTIVARPKQLFAPYYLGYYLNSDTYHNQILSLMQGTKVSSISKSNLQVTEISFPIIDEQEKIGNFFNKLDQSIALQQQKLDKLNDLKKAYLNELFV